MTRPATLLRLAALASALTGFVHLLVPDLLLRTAETGYDRVLAVDFDPRENSPRRVRLLGLLAIAVGWALWRGAAVFED